MSRIHDPETKDPRQPIRSRLADVPLIGAVLVTKGFIDEATKKRILDVILDKQAKGEKTGFFGEEALLLKKAEDGPPLLTRSQLNQALMEQANLKILAALDDLKALSSGSKLICTPTNTETVTDLHIARQPHWGNGPTDNPVNHTSTNAEKINNPTPLPTEYKEFLKNIQATKEILLGQNQVSQDNIETAKTEALSALANLAELILLYACKYPDSLSVYLDNKGNQNGKTISTINQGILALSNLCSLFCPKDSNTTNVKSTTSTDPTIALEKIRMALSCAVAMDVYDKEENPTGPLSKRIVQDHITNRSAEIEAGITALTLEKTQGRSNSR